MVNLFADLFALLTICCRRCICCSVFTVCGSLQSFASILFTLGLIAYAAGWGSNMVSQVCCIWYPQWVLLALVKLQLSTYMGSLTISNFISGLLQRFSSIRFEWELRIGYCFLAGIRWNHLYRPCILPCNLGIPIHKITKVSGFYNLYDLSLFRKKDKMIISKFIELNIYIFHFRAEELRSQGDRCICLA